MIAAQLNHLGDGRRRRAAQPTSAGRSCCSRACACTSGDEVSHWLEANVAPVLRRSSRGGSAWSELSEYELENGQLVFCKSSPRERDVATFAAEAAGLRALAKSGTLRVPRVLHTGSSGGGAFLLLERLSLEASVNQAELGRCLARLHASPTGGKFGFEMDNTIGGTPQLNGWSDAGGTAAWVSFFAEKRLDPQLALTRDDAAQRLGSLVIARMPSLFVGLDITPSLLHGDLWSGNFSSADGQPCVLDPACYYGHAEAEFGMSWCAGFTTDFWTAYHSLLPRQPGWEARTKLYRLYHFLNHYNLFGDSYRPQCMSLLQELARNE